MASKCKGKEIVRGLIPAFIFIISLPLFTLAQTQSQGLKIGDPAPEIKFERLLQAPADATINVSSLKGKVIVLEFWATWCLPCAPAIKHFNKLAEEFKGKPVQFIAVTDEDDQSRIAEYLKEVPIQGWIAIDTDSSVFNAYKVSARPHTVILNQEGKIAAITYPQNVSSGVITDLTEGKKVSLPLKPMAAGSTEKILITEGQSPPLFKMIIEPSSAGGGMFRQPGLIEAEGIVPLIAIGTAYRISTYRIISDLPLSKGFYKISARVTKGQEERLYPALQQALEMTFGIKTRMELREKDVLILTKSQGKAGNLRPSQENEAIDIVWAKGTIKAKKQPIKKLADLLEEAFLYQPVVDETGLREEYDWELPYNRAGNSVLLNAIRENLGLELVKARRKIEVLVVENAEPAR